MRYDHNFLLNCDWLQIHVKAGIDFLERENPLYHFRRSGQSKIWKNIYEIKRTGFPNVVAQYCTDAQECVMRPGHGVLKLENNQLYCHDDLPGYVTKLLEDLQFKFINITRLDIAMDFQKFYMDKNPMEVIKEFSEHKIVSVGGSRKTNAVMFKQHNRYHEFQSLYIGSKKSDIQVKMYNKTEELKHTLKPWIKSLHDQTFADPGPVWRVEFSLYSLSKAVLENMKGESIPYNSIDVLQHKNLYGLFQGLFIKKFAFRTCGTAKRIARMQPLHLWHFDYNFLKLDLIRQCPLVKPSGRAERLMLRELNAFAEQQTDPELKKLSKQLLVAAMRKIKCKSITGLDKPKRIFLKKLKKVLTQKEYDDQLRDAAREVCGRIISEYQLQDFAQANNIDYTGFENYIFNVQEFLKIKANEEKLKRESAAAIAAANEQFINDLALEIPFYNY